MKHGRLACTFLQEQTVVGQRKKSLQWGTSAWRKKEKVYADADESAITDLAAKRLLATLRPLQTLSRPFLAQIPVESS